MLMSGRLIAAFTEGIADYIEKTDSGGTKNAGKLQFLQFAGEYISFLLLYS